MFPFIPVPELVARGLVAPLPEVARQRIVDRYNCNLTLSGTEIPAVSLLRDLIQSLDTDLRFARALSLSAPHTHWSGEMIVESLDHENGFLLNGPTGDSSPGIDFKPISFVFTSDGPIPYEWADGTILIPEQDLAEVCSFIVRVNQELLRNSALPLPVGIMIDHRFKKSIWDDQLFTFAEGEHDEYGGRAKVHPVFESVVHDNPPFPNTIQVAWSAFPTDSFFDPELTSEETKALTELESMVKDSSTDDAIELVCAIERRLHEEEGRTKR